LIVLIVVVCMSYKQPNTTNRVEVQCMNQFEYQYQVVCCIATMLHACMKEINPIYIGLPIPRLVPYSAHHRHDVLYWQESGRYNLYMWGTYIHVWDVSQWHEIIAPSTATSNTQPHIIAHLSWQHPPCLHYGKSTLLVVMQGVVHDIVGHHGDGDHTEYLVCLGCENPKVWIEPKHLKSFLESNLLIKSKPWMLVFW